LDARIEALNCVEKELAASKEEAKRMKRELADARQALQEFSQALSESKLRMVELKDEIGLPSNGAKWMEDNEANQCKLCAIQFSIVQRRHHCR
jgi:septal ring factor EnvC (AmiA/AmiB activator)